LNLTLAASLPRHAAARINECCDQVKQRKIFTGELQSALRFKVEFSKTYCKLMICWHITSLVVICFLYF
jgi:hypothetical protein